MSTTRTRLKDVAERLSLSPALVSGVLNNRDKVWASEETRARIFEAARALNYRPNTAAQALSSGRTRTIALVYRRLPTLDYRLAYTGLVDVFSEELQARGYDLRVSNFATNEDVLHHLDGIASARSCDAVILWGREADTGPQGELLESLGIPFVVKGRHETGHPHWNQIDFDHEWMMVKAVERLVCLGHYRLAYLGFAHDEPFTQALRKGFVEGHNLYLGREPNPLFFGACEDEVEPNAKKIREWMSLPESERPTGFVIGAGNHAWHALEACLAPIGLVLGDKPENVGAAGIVSYYFTLMFGEAHVYQGIEIDRLAGFGGPALLDAVLGEPRENSVIRFRPEMSPAPCLNLLGHGVGFARPTP